MSSDPSTASSTAMRQPRWASVQAAWRRLGLFGALLAAAVLAEVIVATSDVLQSGVLDESATFGGRLRAGAMLPGALMLAVCAVLGRKRPMLGAVLGSASLLVASPIVELYAGVYTSLLYKISLTETVAGVQLVVLAHQMLPRDKAKSATALLVLACLGALTLRGNTYHPDLNSLVIGLVLLCGAVAYGRRGADAKYPLIDERDDYAIYLAQWPLIGGVALFVFFEFTSLGGSVAGVAVFVCSLAAAVCAVISVRHPITAGLGLAAAFLITAMLGGALRYDFPGFFASPLPATQVLAGIVVSVNLVRLCKAETAAGVILAMSVAVGLATAAQARTGLPRAAMMGLLVLGMCIALGLYLRSRDTARAQLMTAAVTEAKSAERMALARELHDVVAHHVTGIVVQAQAAKMVAQNDPRLTQEAFDRIETAGIEAMNAMRRLVGSIRSGDAPTEDATMDLAADLRKLVDTASHGVRTDLQVDIGADLPPEVARSALRIVQEALTNIGKHAANATVARVAVGVVNRELGIRVSDDGRGGGEHAPLSWRDSGYGLVGMRERVQLLNGRLSVGPAPDGGWVVEAWLPLQTVEDTPT